MSTDKTLADVQPGGRVRLGDVLPPLPKMEHIGRVVGMGPHDTWYEPVAYTAEQMRDYARAALSAQPSPGGQGDAWDIAELVRTDLDRQSCPDAYMRIAMESVVKHLAARQPVETQLGYTLSDVHEAYSRGKRDAARQPVALIAQKVGDYRVTVAEDAITVSRGRDIVFAYSAGDAEPINARQPVGQIVGYMDPNADFMLARPGDCVLMGNIVLWREPGSKYTKPLYDAPPAQAVDLSTLERFECQLYENPWPHSKMDEVDGGDWVRFDDVKALIDSRTVQTAQAVDLDNVIDQIAQQWDGCSYDAVGETIDVGQAIRAAGKRLLDKKAAANG
ncbi:hypothetical protein [Stenotrophomonas maltophilia]|uniref:hypothetical protein n=1 Tax=Stenotrophomonas maltophilia TaxID=40324 RepID=UPI0016610D67|nr:hypothetical protein [Stenotrophomonas maltophilia]